MRRKRRPLEASRLVRVYCVTNSERSFAPSRGRIEPPARAAPEGTKEGTKEGPKERKVGSQAPVPVSHPPSSSPDRSQFASLHEVLGTGKPGTREAPTSATAASWADGAPVLWGLCWSESVRRPVPRTDAPRYDTLVAGRWLVHFAVRPERAHLRSLRTWPTSGVRFRRPFSECCEHDLGIPVSAIRPPSRAGAGVSPHLFADGGGGETHLGPPLPPGAGCEWRCS
jgi:hypothetical protein